MSSVINSATSGLMAYQRAIDVASQNIANANTEGYVRLQAALSPQTYGPDNYGLSAGVRVDGIRRNVSEFLIQQSRTANSAANRAEIIASYSSQVGDMLGSGAQGLDDSFQALKNGFEALAADPSSLLARDALLASMQDTVTRVKFFDDRLTTLTTGINTRLGEEVTTINTALREVAALNDKIARTPSGPDGSPPPALLDQRDRLLDQLSGRLGLKVTATTLGMVSVKTSDDRLLVNDGDYATLSVTNGRYDSRLSTISMVPAGGGTSADLTSALGGGNLSGLIEARNSTVEASRIEMGRLVVALTRAINSQNAAGRTLDGTAADVNAAPPLNGALLKAGGVTTLNADNNSAGFSALTLSAVLDATANSPPADEYIVTWGGASWTVTKAGSGAAVTSTGTASSIQFDNLTVTITGTGQATGDSFMVRPAIAAVADFGRTTSNARMIAAASASGTFGVGDNRNAVELVKSFEKLVFDSNTVSLLTGASRLASRLASQVYSSELSSEIQRAAADEALKQRSDMYGVSLDEEAADLLRFQKGYQAVASVMRTANELFDTLLGATS
jgi:flagellar hook-associated protein 1 FlgK